MKRRDFMRLGLAGAGLSALSAMPQIATAQSASAQLWTKFRCL